MDETTQNTTTIEGKVLIVEDEQGLSDSLSYLLQKNGITTFTAKNGDEALTLALQHRPHIVICDIAMPEVDGLSFIKELRKDPWGSEVYVFMLTNYSDSDHIARVVSLGITTYFVKSDVSLEKVINHIKDYLEKHPISE